VAEITSEADLRALHAPPKERTLRKQLDRLDRHCRRFIELSPFVVLATAGADGRMDATPRGGEPGFVTVADDTTLLLPDRPGNNRLDSLTNLTEVPEIGLLFMIPGVDETLRVNGRARLLDDAALLASFANEKRTPKLAIEVKVEDAYLHCAKALMRSRLWDPQSRKERSVLPTMGQMLNEQTGVVVPAETQEQMVERYQADL
jgi:PPOX class probable FMN-dependent enzyme